MAGHNNIHLWRAIATATTLGGHTTLRSPRLTDTGLAPPLLSSASGPVYA